MKISEVLSCLASDPVIAAVTDEKWEEAIKSPEAMTTQQKYACDLNADGTINDADKALLDVK